MATDASSQPEQDVIGGLGVLVGPGVSVAVDAIDWQCAAGSLPLDLAARLAIYSHAAAQSVAGSVAQRINAMRRMRDMVTKPT